MSHLIHWKNENQEQIPRWAVLFSLERTNDLEGYDEMDKATLNTVAEWPGYLGYESVYQGSRGIFISYWESREAIDAWKTNSLHMQAKNQAGKWYKAYISAITQIHAWHAMPQNKSFP